MNFIRLLLVIALKMTITMVMMILAVKFDKTIVDFSCNTKLVLTCIKLNKHLNTYMFGMIKANITMYIYINKIDLHLLYPILSFSFQQL